MSSTTVIKILPVGFAILKALAEYRYLTRKQMLTLGITQDNGYLGKVLTSLLSVKRRDSGTDRKERRPKEIGELDFGTMVGRGRLSRVYYLTKRGAKLLERLERLDPQLEPVPYAKRPVLFSPDYHHRVSCVDFHIALNGWATANDNTVPYYHQYFDWSPASAKGRPEPSTRLSLSHRRVDADALFLLRDATGTDRSFVFEMVNGRDTGRVIDKMQHLALGLNDKSLNRALSFPADKAVRILFEFEHRRTAELVAPRAAANPLIGKFGPHFLLKARDDRATRRIWLMAAMRPCLAERRATRRARIASTAPLRAFASPVAWPD